MFYLEISILIITLSFDTLIAGISMGIEKIKVPLSSILILNMINTIFLFISCLLGSKIFNFCSNEIIFYLPSIIFIILGIIKIIESIYQELKQKKYILKLSNIKCIIRIYHEPCKADLDNSKTLSLKELIFLAIALSLDNVIAGIGLGHYINSLSFIIIFHFIFGLCFFYLFNRIILKVNINKINTSFICGIIFIIVGIFRIIA